MAKMTHRMANRVMTPLLLADLLFVASLSLLLSSVAALPLRTFGLHPASGGFSRTSTWIYSGSTGVRHVAHSVVPSQTSTYFQRWTSTRVSGIHTSLTMYDTVIIIDRTDTNNTNAKWPDGRTIYGEEYSFADNVFRPLDVKTNVFCSSGQTLEDGTLISIGGASDANNPDPVLNGSFSIRSLPPCKGGNSGQNCEFILNGNMTSKRWYPTTQILPDGRVFIVGGANIYGNVAINTMNTNNPTFEFWPRRAGEGNFILPLLQDVTNLPFNLYPFVHLMPSGLLYIFAGQISCLLNYKTNQVTKNLPVMDNKGYSRYTAGMENIMRTYPVSGTSAMLPLKPDNNYKATILICGGNYNTATVNNKGTDGSCQGCLVVATPICGTIQPEDLAPKWVYEAMPQGRVMPDAVLLLDDVVLICNGGGRGFQGLKPTYATVPRRQPVLYDTTATVGSRFYQVPDDEGINRMYHSSALLLSDGQVYISGSNPNPYLVPYNPNAPIANHFPTEFRTSIFRPHYLQYGVSQNVLTNVPKNITIGSVFAISFTTSITTPIPLRIAERTRFRVVLVFPGFSTHNQRHGMRNVILPITALAKRKTGSTTKYTLIVRSPPNGNVAPASIYWLHVLDQGGYKANNVWQPRHWVPNVRGAPIRLWRKKFTVSSTVAKSRISAV